MDFKIGELVKVEDTEHKGKIVSIENSQIMVLFENGKIGYYNLEGERIRSE